MEQKFQLIQRWRASSEEHAIALKGLIMRLNQSFLKLPKRFCAETLAQEVRALPASAWIPHPDKHPGNEAVPLVTVGGDINNAFTGKMAPTEHLLKCRYVMEIMAHIGAVWGRSRFMGLAGGSVVPPHVDINHYWRTHLRIHIPVITTPAVTFTCGAESVHMAPGECWIFDSFRTHTVKNDGEHQRVHLVVDTVGGDELWELIQAARGSDNRAEPPVLQPGQTKVTDLQFEQVNTPKIMSPWEIRCHAQHAAENVVPDERTEAIFRRLDKFAYAWGAAWARFGDSEEGLSAYTRLRDAAAEDLKSLGAPSSRMTNNIRLSDVIDHSILKVAVPAEPSSGPTSPPKAKPQPATARPPAAPERQQFADLLERPIFIVSTPRSGSTMLFDTLRQARGAYTTGRESHGLIEGMRRFHPASSGWSSNRLIEADAVPAAVEELSRRFYLALGDRDGSSPRGPARMIEKTPKNCLRVPFLASAYPDATFLYLYRDPRQTMSSMIEAWRSGRFRTYPDLPAWRGLPWSLLLVPGWRDLNGKQLPEIVARQWATASDILVDDLSNLPADRVRSISYADLVASPQESMKKLCASLGLEWDRDLGESLPLSPTTVSAPDPEKWRANEHLIEPVWPIVEGVNERAQRFAASFNREALAVG